MTFLWIKALHIVAIIAWMAGLLYLPRLYVYHAGTAVGSEASETFKVMERRLLRAIMNPAMIAVFILGGALVMIEGSELMHAGWFHIKVLLVLVLTVMHGLMARWRRAIAAQILAQILARILGRWRCWPLISTGSKA